MKHKLTDSTDIEKGIYTFLNPFSYLKLRKKGLIENFDRIYCDGILFVYLAKLLGKKIKRVSFDMTSLAPIVFSFAEEKQCSIAIVGGKEGVAYNAGERFKRQYPEMKIVYTGSGFFKHEEHRKNLIKKLVIINPDIVLIGMGAGTQENFLLDVRQAGWDGIGYTCGGFLHQSIKKQGNYYPEFMNKYNLRWLYRIYDEPKLIKRYLIFYPYAIFCFFFDTVCKKNG